MHRRTPILRCFLIASLLVSLSLTSLYPRLTMAHDQGAGKQENQNARACCCGADARCQGQACCQMAVPKENAPSTPKPTEDRGQPLGLFSFQSLAVVALPAIQLSDSDARLFAPLGSPSLIRLSIRLNT
jgi:hypothetical protein